MPAVTVDDLLVLPKVDPPDPGAVERPVVSVTTAPSGVEGEGFPVYRAFAGVASIDPFVHMDRRWHPAYRGAAGVPGRLGRLAHRQTNHPVMGSVMHGDTWSWCYIHELTSQLA